MDQRIKKLLQATTLSQTDQAETQAWLERELLGESYPHQILSHQDAVPGIKARGDLLVVDSSKRWTRKAIGTSGQYLVVDGNGDPTWTTLTTTHALLSATHTDTTAANVTRGDIITGQGATPKWTRLGKGNYGDFLSVGTNEPAWSKDIGDGTNYSRFASDGSLSMAGTAKKTHSYFVGVEDMYAIAGAGATAGTRAIGASNTVNANILSFVQTATTGDTFKWRVPDWNDATTGISVYIVWVPATGWSSGNCYWKMTYIVKAESGGATNTGTGTDIAADVTPANATTILASVMSGTITANPGDIVYCKLVRDHAQDNGSDPAELIGVKFTPTISKLGA